MFADSINGVDIKPPLPPFTGLVPTLDSTGKFANWTAGGSIISIAGTPVTNPNFIAGTNVTFGVAGSNVTINSSGAAGPTGPQGVPGTTNVPWLDIQTYGSQGPKGGSFSLPTAGATTTASSPNVTIASGSFATRLINGQGVCIWKAGSATAQSTPSAPTVTCPNTLGSQTLTYKIVGYDSLGGLTAASTAATVTTAPAVFGPLPVTLTSITASGGVVTANFSGPLNNTVTAGMTIHIVNVIGSGSTWNGVWTIASAPSTSQVTYNVSGAAGTGTVSGSSYGRLSNSLPISAISRTADGTMTVTFAQSHHYQGQSGGNQNQTVFTVEGVQQVDMNGTFIISSGTATTLVCSTGILSAETGSVTPGATFCTVWEFATVTCPLPSGSTLGYYIYSDSPNPGGALTLIGKTLPQDNIFTDWGQTIAAGYVAPAYVPTTPPSSAQNQMFTSTVVSGGGTTSLVLANNVPTGIAALGATIMFDDGPNLIAAANAAIGSSNIGGAVLLSPSKVVITQPAYVFNSPITFPANVNLIIGAACVINETITLTGQNQVSGILGSTTPTTPQFGQQNYVQLSGIGNPMMAVASNAFGACAIDGLVFNCLSNGAAGFVVLGAFYTRLSNVCFTAAQSFGNAVGVVYLGSCSGASLENSSFLFGNRFFGPNQPGQSSWGPPIGALWFRSTPNTSIPNNAVTTSQFAFRGLHTWSGRGILFDHRYATLNDLTDNIEIGDVFWVQQATTPTIMLWGVMFAGFTVNNVTNDSSLESVIANLAQGQVTDFYLYNSSNANAGYPLITGNPFVRLSVSGGNEYLNQYQPTLKRTTSASFTTTSATSDVVTVPYYGFGAVSITPTNASAAADMALGNVYVSAKGSGTVTIAHRATAGETFDILAVI